MSPCLPFSRMLTRLGLLCHLQVVIPTKPLVGSKLNIVNSQCYVAYFKTLHTQCRGSPASSASWRDIVSSTHSGMHYQAPHQRVHQGRPLLPLPGSTTGSQSWAGQACTHAHTHINQRPRGCRGPRGGGGEEVPAVHNLGLDRLAPTQNINQHFKGCRGSLGGGCGGKRLYHEHSTCLTWLGVQ